MDRDKAWVSMNEGTIYNRQGDTKIQLGGRGTRSCIRVHNMGVPVQYLFQNQSRFLVDLQLKATTTHLTSSFALQSKPNNMVKRHGILCKLTREYTIFQNQTPRSITLHINCILQY